MTTIPVAILAAGPGSRLGALTDARPKCLLAVGDTSPPSLALDAIDDSAMVGEVLVVVGRARDAIERFLESRPRRAAIRLHDDPRYDTANTIDSAYLLVEHARDALPLLDSDVACHPAILREAASVSGTYLDDEVVQGMLHARKTRPDRYTLPDELEVDRCRAIAAARAAGIIGAS